MNRYSILCTEEQTKKALELGAPIEECSYSINPHVTLVWKVTKVIEKRFLGYDGKQI